MQSSLVEDAPTTTNKELELVLTISPPLVLTPHNAPLKLPSRKNRTCEEKAQRTSEGAAKEDKYKHKGATSLKLCPNIFSPTKAKTTVLPINESSIIIYDSCISPSGLGSGNSLKVLQTKEYIIPNRFSFKRFSLNPKNMLLFFASMSCIGSIVLICLVIYTKEQCL